jgi:hypothetical protein
LLARLHSTAQLPATDGGQVPKPPTLVIAIDQGEELFLTEAQGEARAFLALLRDLVVLDAPSVIAVFTIRSDNYERLQSAPELDGVHQEMLSLPPMPRGSYAEVIKGPIRRLDGTARACRLDEALVDALLADVEAGGAKDALPLLAFTLERLYGEYGASGETTIEPAHEALLRQWGLLQGLLEEDTAVLSVLDGIKRAARDWAANAKAPSWLTHNADRLRAAERLLVRPDLAANLEPTDRDYVDRLLLSVQLVDPLQC